MAIAFAKPLTGVGVEPGVRVPSPSCPRELLPQQRPEPSASTAQLRSPPALIATAGETPKPTKFGVRRLAPLAPPSPS
jgi:hypothetical protein